MKLDHRMIWKRDAVYSMVNAKRFIISVIILFISISVSGAVEFSPVVTDVWFGVPMEALPLQITPGIGDSIWIVMEDEPIIRLIDGTGTAARSFGGFGTGFCEFRDRISLIDSRSLFIYTADTDNQRILKMDRGGVCVREIRNYEMEKRETWRPVALAASESGRIYVSDADGGTVHYLDTFDGLRPFINPSDRGTAIPVQPVSLACDDERLYIADGSDGTLYVFDKLGNLLGRKITDFDICSLDVTMHGYCAVADQTTNDIYLGPWESDEWMSIREMNPSLSTVVPSNICFTAGSDTPKKKRHLMIVDSAARRIVKLEIRFS